ncbi:hypothetical protein HT105_23775, partial [Bacteroides fragilis]|nr:hypothetical protein [Bacteroides fragilis]
MLIPRVVGFKLTGEIPVGVTATDVVLTITEMLHLYRYRLPHHHGKRPGHPGLGCWRHRG